MTITPEFERREKKIFEVFQKMNWEEQYLTIGRMQVEAERNYHRKVTAERMTRACQTSDKIVQFPSIASI